MLATFVINQEPINNKVYTGRFCTLLIYSFTLAPIPHCLINLDLLSGMSTNFALHQDSLSYSWPFAFSYKF